MDINDIITNSLSYVFKSKNYKPFLILSIFVMIITFLTQSATDIHNIPILFLIAAILLIFLLFYSGYSISIIRNTLANKDKIPNFLPKRNILDGVKYLIVAIALVIPIIIVLIVIVFLLGDSLEAVSSFNLMISVLLMLLLGLYLILLFIIDPIIKVILSQSNSIKECLNFKRIFGKISKIGWGSYLIFLVVLFFVISIITMIYFIIIIAIQSSLNSFGINTVITIIFSSLYTIYLEIFRSRAYGLLCSNVKVNGNPHKVVFENGQYRYVKDNNYRNYSNNDYSDNSNSDNDNTADINIQETNNENSNKILDFQPDDNDKSYEI